MSFHYRTVFVVDRDSIAISRYTPVPSLFAWERIKNELYELTRTVFLVRGKRSISMHDTYNLHDQLGWVVISVLPDRSDAIRTLFMAPSVILVAYFELSMSWSTNVGDRIINLFEGLLLLVFSMVMQFFIPLSILHYRSVVFSLHLIMR